MTPEEVALVYLKQAKKLEEFLLKFKEKENNPQEVGDMLFMITQSYIELLYNLYFYIPLLTGYNVNYPRLKSVGLLQA